MNERYGKREEEKRKGEEEKGRGREKGESGSGKRKGGVGVEEEEREEKRRQNQGRVSCESDDTLSPLPNCETLSEREREFRSQLSLYALGLKSSKNCFDEENSK